MPKIGAKLVAYLISSKCQACRSYCFENKCQVWKVIAKLGAYLPRTATLWRSWSFLEELELSEGAEAPWRKSWRILKILKKKKAGAGAKTI